MNQANLLELTHRALAETMREITRRSHGVIHEEKGLLLYASGASDAALWNGALRTEPGLAAADLIQKATEFFGQRQRGFSYTRWNIWMPMWRHGCTQRVAPPIATALKWCSKHR